MKKTVLITGASSGIGKDTATLFAQRGWNVVATLRDPSAHDEWAGQDHVLVTRLDVQDATSIHSAIAAGIARFGRIDALVNNAGFGLFGVFEATSPEKIREQFDVNVFGVMEVTRALLPHFRQHRSGTILNVSSGAGIFTLPMISLYCASKWALEGFSESLAYELSALGITVKLVEPGGVRTNFSNRSAHENAQASSIPDYDAFIAGSNAVFADLSSKRLASTQQVAQVIFEAATDGSKRLRYLGTEDIAPLVKARRELPDQDYVDFMRAQFMPPA
jgi:NAD(P)-dependent dehydrogenase (short-subunit alcohol dehydrogenase family)